MTGQLFIQNEIIGEVQFKVIDPSMGVIGGNLVPNENYKKYQPTIQSHFERNGVSNINDFSFKIKLDDIELYTEGGIGVIDCKTINEIYVEAAGVDQDNIELIMV